MQQHYLIKILELNETCECDFIYRLYLSLIAQALIEILGSKESIIGYNHKYYLTSTLRSKAIHINGRLIYQ